MVGVGLIVGVSSGGVAASAPAPSDVWPLTGMGVEANWTIGADCSFVSGPPTAVAFGEPVEGTANSLAGAAKTSFDAAVSSSTACNVTLTQVAGDHPDVAPGAGTVFVVMKGGTPVAFVFDGTPSQEVVHSVTSGAGSGFDLIAGAGFPVPAIADVEIVL